jgi:hypothetical protein
MAQGIGRYILNGIKFDKVLIIFHLQCFNHWFHQLTFKIRLLLHAPLLKDLSVSDFEVFHCLDKCCFGVKDFQGFPVLIEEKGIVLPQLD